MLFRDGLTRSMYIGVMAACASMAMGCSHSEVDLPAEDVSVDIAIQMHEMSDTRIAGASQAQGIFSLAGILPFEYTDIASLRLDIRETATDQYLYTNIWLEQSAGEWVTTIPHLPVDTELDFVARAYDGDDVEIFNGNTLRTFVSGDAFEIVTIPMAPFNDGTTYEMPRIASIQYRESFVTRQEDIVTFAIEGKGGAVIRYEITAADGSPAPFYPSSGQITLAGLAGQFVSNYKAPEVTETTDFDYVVTLTGDGNTQVKTSFTTTVNAGAEGATDTRIQVRYNPVINAVTTTRPPGTTDVTWEATVSDNSDISTLTYQWTFTPGATFTPVPALAGTGQTNPATLQSYSEPVYGTMQLEVTDPDGGVTSLLYNLMPSQFPDTPVDPGTAEGLRSIQAGGDHTCVLFNNGKVRCWGQNDFGQLGYGNTFAIGDDELPYEAGDVPLPASDPAVQIVTGTDHTCALLQSGYVRCWGRNNAGQLGLGHLENLGDGEDVTGLLGGIVNLGGIAVKLAAGGHHTCALMDTGGMRCWGWNADGQLGYAHTNTIGDDEAVYPEGEVAVGGVVTDISAGYYHTCALLDDGTVRCWGYAGDGQLGYGDTTNIGDDETPAAVGTVSISGSAVQIEAGYYHTCALLGTGYMRCWGDGRYGALGDGQGDSYTNSGGLIPHNIGDNELPSSIGLTTTGATVTQVAAGEDHTCALLSNSQIKCWGRHNNGRLGYGTNDHNAPAAGGVNLDGSNPFQLTAGGTHTCTLLSTGNAWCWGQASSGQLGYGNTTDINSPPAGGDIQVLAP